MDLLSLIALIIIGFLAGFIASVITGWKNSALVNIILGVIGAAVGNFIFRALGIYVSNNFVGPLISATVGALLVIIVAQAIMGKPRMRM